MKINFPLIPVGIFINQSHAAIQMKPLRGHSSIRSVMHLRSMNDISIRSLVDLKPEMLRPDRTIHDKFDFFINDNYAIGGQVRLRYPIVLTTIDQCRYDRGVGRILSRGGNVMMSKSKPAIQLTHSLSLIL